MTIDVLPDNVLVEIFVYVNVNIRSWDSKMRIAWHALVHVCRRWRYLVFASPRRLNLQLGYRGYRPMLEALEAWPVLPVLLTLKVELLHGRFLHSKLDQWLDNMVAALKSEHFNRICEIRIVDYSNSRWERLTAAMQKPFPELRHLTIWVYDDVASPLPDSFLGGSAPRLRTLSLRGIPFPSMPKLLSSANDLITLSLSDISDSGYISPDAIVTALTAMTRLETLQLKFRSPPSRRNPANRPLPLPTRFVLPALAKLIFEGAYEYLEDLLSSIDFPLLYRLHITFFMDFNFDVPHLRRLIGHAEEFKSFDRAQVVLIYHHSIKLRLYPKTEVLDHHGLHELQIEIICGELDLQVSSLAKLYSSSFPLITTLEELEIRDYAYVPSSHQRNGMENAPWLELLHPFTALKNLYLPDTITRCVCGALSGERSTQVLPALRKLFVRTWPSQPIQNAIMPFVTARQLSGHPLVVDCWIE